MSNDTSVSLKVYITDGDNSIDIRRFEVDQSVITSYDYLRERLQVVIPKLRGRVFKLLWQDAEGDDVTISSDEELMIALMNIDSNVCKFIVRLKQNDENESYYETEFDIFPKLTSLTDQCPAFTEAKDGQACNSCQKPLTGVRYKCLECIQYYQCPDCEYKNEHAEHIMLRLQKSMSFGSVVHKCKQILKNHLIHGSKCVGARSIFREKMPHSACNKEKERYHRKRFHKHGCHSGGKHTQEDSSVECPFSGLLTENIQSIINGFLDMYKKFEPNSNTEEEKPKESNTNENKTEKNVSESNITEPSAPSESAMDVEPSTSSNNNDRQKEDQVSAALQMLAEMGFVNNEWLKKLVEHFDGDLAKTIDCLIQRK